MRTVVRSDGSVTAHIATDVEKSFVLSAWQKAKSLLANSGNRYARASGCRG